MNETLTINQRIKRLEKAVFGRRGETGGTPKSAAKASDFAGPTGGVRFLISKDYFRKKKALAEIRSALAQHDYHYSAQAVHEALKRLIQKGGPLVSLREGGKKMYVKRK
jgi:hypothetical protein